MYPKTATWEPDTMRDRQMLTRAKGDEIRPEILCRNEIDQRGSGARGARGGASGGVHVRATSGGSGKCEHRA